MKNKSLYIIMIIAIILGAIIVKTKGFNYSTLYSEHKRVEIIIGKEYELRDIEKIADESIKEEHVTRKTTLYGTSVSIDAKDITDDELNTLFSKLNEKYSKSYNIKDVKKDDILQEQQVESISDKSDDEVAQLVNQIREKYGLEYTVEELKDASTQVKVYDVQKIGVWDIIKKIISPLVISLVIVMVYVAIRYHKLYKNAWIIEPVQLGLELIISQLFVLAILAIARIPVGSYISAILLLVWVLELLTRTMQDEKRFREYKLREEEKKTEKTA